MGIYKAWGAHLGFRGDSVKPNPNPSPCPCPSPNPNNNNNNNINPILGSYICHAF